MLRVLKKQPRQQLEVRAGCGTRPTGLTRGTDREDLNGAAKLMFLCGKMAAGKSTLARDLAVREDAILLVQDDFLEYLWPGEIADMPEFIDRSARLKDALAPHICALLSKGLSVVLDFPGNTKAQRAWFRELLERANVEHELHFVDAPDDRCKRQLKHRSRSCPPAQLGPPLRNSRL